MFRRQNPFTKPSGPSVPSIFSCCKNRKRLILVWILPWIVLIGFGFMLLTNFVNYKQPPPPTNFDEPFDWTDLQWDYSDPKETEPERITPKIYGFLIDPVRDAYIYPPQPVKTGFTIVKNCTFDTNGYYIKDDVRYPTQHKWLIPQYEIDEPEPIKHFEDKCICLYVPRSFREMNIIIDIMPRLLALPDDDLRTLPIYTNCGNEIIEKILSETGYPTSNIVRMRGAVNAKYMYVLDYPDINTFPYADFAHYKYLLGRAIGSNEPPNSKITIDKLADTRLQDIYDETLVYYRAVDSKIEPVDVLNRAPTDLMRFFQTQSCFVTFGTVNLGYSIFMRPKSKLIAFNNMLDVIDGVKLATYAGAQVHIIGTRNRTITPKSREYVLKVIERECSETHLDDDDEEDNKPLNLDDIDFPNDEEKYKAKQNEILSKLDKTTENGVTKYKNQDRKSEIITGELNDE